MRSEDDVVGDMVEQRTAAKMNRKEMAPMVVILSVEIDDNGDERSSVSNGVAKGKGGGNGNGGGGRRSMQSFTVDGWGGGVADGGGRGFATSVGHGDWKEGSSGHLIR